MADRGLVRQRIGLAAAWLFAAAIAVTVGVVAVTSVGDQIRDRGPQGNNELIRSANFDSDRGDTPDPGQSLFEKTFSDDFGEFDVACQGKFAIGVQARPNLTAGWRTISYESGPDDDIDAVFSNGDRSQELEIYCNLGRPVLSELENNNLPENE